MKNEDISKNEVINEIKQQKRLCIDRDIIDEVQKSLNEKYSQDKTITRWGPVHFSVVKEAINKQSQKEKTLSRDYLYTLKVNYDALSDYSLIKALLAFIGVVISIILALNSSSGSENTTYFLFAYSLIILLLMFIYYMIITIMAKNSYKNRFYKQIIECILNENK